MALAKYNYRGTTTQSQTSILSDVGSVLSGQGTKANLFGHINLSSAAVGITNTSTTVTWAGADDGSVTAARKNIEVGQSVFGTGIPDGTTVATITNQVGFTLSLAATATNAAAILTLDETATQPTSTIGSTTKAISTSSGSPNLTITGMCTATLGIVAVGMSVEGFGIPAGTTVSSISSANVLVMSANATATVSPATIVLSPPSSEVVCDTANTYIYTTYSAAGWKLWDMYANAGVANMWVFRAPVVDDSTFYKYMMLDVSSDGFIQLHLYETWNNSTHAGTNQATALATTNQQRLTKTVAATLYISASARHIVLQSIIAAGTGASSQGDWTGIFERTRVSPWDTVANAYPPSILTCGFGLTGSAVTSYACRYKNPVGGDLTTTNATLSPACLGAGNQTQGFSGITTVNFPTQKIPDGLGGFYVPATDITFRNSATTKLFLGGSISQVCDVWLSVLYPNNTDEVSISGTTYIFLQNATTFSTYGSIIVPKG